MSIKSDIPLFLPDFTQVLSYLENEPKKQIFVRYNVAQHHWEVHTLSELFHSSFSDLGVNNSARATYEFMVLKDEIAELKAVINQESNILKSVKIKEDKFLKHYEPRTVKHDSDSDSDLYIIPKTNLKTVYKLWDEIDEIESKIKLAKGKLNQLIKKYNKNSILLDTFGKALNIELTLPFPKKIEIEKFQKKQVSFSDTSTIGDSTVVTKTDSIKKKTKTTEFELYDNDLDALLLSDDLDIEKLEVIFAREIKRRDKEHITKLQKASINKGQKEPQQVEDLELFKKKSTHIVNLFRCSISHLLTYLENELLARPSEMDAIKKYSFFQIVFAFIKQENKPDEEVMDVESENVEKSLIKLRQSGHITIDEYTESLDILNEEDPSEITVSINPYFPQSEQMDFISSQLEQLLAPESKLVKLIHKWMDKVVAKQAPAFQNMESTSFERKVKKRKCEDKEVNLT